MPRSLIVNADDLGLSAGVNDGIFDAHVNGVLTSVSLFAAAPATADAVARLALHPALGVGCHLALVDLAPVLPLAQVRSLVDDRGRFHRSWRPFIAGCLRKRVSLAEVERELTAQIDKLRCEGVALTHLDGHQHVHAYPPIFEMVSRLAARFAIPSVRVPFERRAAAAGVPWTQGVQNLAMWPWARRDRGLAARRGLTTPNFLGRLHTGTLTAGALVKMLRHLPGGVTELMVHPGYPDAALAAVNTRLRESRAAETALLCAPDVREAIAREHVALVRHDLQPSTTRSLRHAS